VVSDQSVVRGSPEGRAARRTWWLVSGMRWLLGVRRDLLIGRYCLRGPEDNRAGYT
jgi:hypothetical protein